MNSVWNEPSAQRVPPATPAQKQPVSDGGGRQTVGAVPRTPPWPWLIPMVVAVTSSAALAASDSTGLHVAGWALGSLATTGFVMAFWLRDSKARMDPMYSPSAAVTPVTLFLFVGGIVASGFNAWPLATLLARV